MGLFRLVWPSSCTLEQIEQATKLHSTDSCFHYSIPAMLCDGPVMTLSCTV